MTDKEIWEKALKKYRLLQAIVYFAVGWVALGISFTGIQGQWETSFFMLLVSMLGVYTLYIVDKAIWRCKFELSA